MVSSLPVVRMNGKIGTEEKVCLYVTSQKPVNSTTAFFAGVGISSCNSVVIIWVIIHLPPFFLFVSGSGTDSVLLHTHSLAWHVI